MCEGDLTGSGNGAPYAGLRWGMILHSSRAKRFRISAAAGAVGAPCRGELGALGSAGSSSVRPRAGNPKHWGTAARDQFTPFRNRRLNDRSCRQSPFSRRCAASRPPNCEAFKPVMVSPNNRHSWVTSIYKGAPGAGSNWHGCHTVRAARHDHAHCNGFHRCRCEWVKARKTGLARQPWPSLSHLWTPAARRRQSEDRVYPPSMWYLAQ